MNSNFAKKFELWICKTKVGIQKIHNLKLDTFEMVIASLLVENKEGKSRFFEKIFLLADISMDITLGMLFLIFSNVVIDFVDYHLY